MVVGIVVTVTVMATGQEVVVKVLGQMATMMTTNGT